MAEGFTCPRCGWCAPDPGPRLTPQQQRIFQALRAAGGRSVAVSDLILAVHRGRDEPEFAEDSLRGQIRRLRARLAPAGWRIACSWGQGYRLERDPA